MLRTLRGAQRRLIAGVVVVAAAALAPMSQPAAPAEPITSVVVQLDGDGSAAHQLVADTGGRITSDLPIISGFAADIPVSAVADLGAAPGVRAVTPDESLHVAATATPSEDSSLKSVFADEVGARKLWSKGYRGAGVNVAVIDTGVSPVKDLAGRITRVQDPQDSNRQVECVNFSGEAGCEDSYGHGTFVAGLIAGDGQASDGRFVGVAPEAGVISLKVAGQDGSADVTKVLAAIQWVVAFAPTYDIKVLNLSLGTDGTVSYRYDPLNLAVERAWQAGITVVVAASNRGPASGTISKPADDPLVVTVGAVDDRETPALSDDRLPAFSGRGPTADGLAKPDIVAPGARVVSLRSPGSYIEEHAGTNTSDPYRRGSGTSMSAGVVSGVVALLNDVDPALTPDRIKFALVATAHQVASDDLQEVGAGLVDADAAAFAAPAGVANADVVPSDGTGTLDGARGHVVVASRCKSSDSTCSVRGNETAQRRSWAASEYRSSDWRGSSWYASQWARDAPDGSSWYGSSWYGSSWYGSSWYGSSWYGSFDADTSYGTSLLGSSWYGAWD